MCLRRFYSYVMYFLWLVEWKWVIACCAFYMKIVGRKENIDSKDLCNKVFGFVLMFTRIFFLIFRD